MTTCRVFHFPRVLVWILTFFLSLILYYANTPLAFAKQKMASTKETKQMVIRVVDKQFQVDDKGKAVKAFELIFIKEDKSISRNGYFGVKGDVFDVIVENKSSEPTTMHWHGLIVPNDQDGVPEVTQMLIQPGESRAYKYKIVQAGTYWMHSHQGLQEQQQLSAPLIIYDPDDKKEEQQEVVMFIEDFTYEDPNMIFKNLRGIKIQNKMKPNKNRADFNDVDYYTHLTNKHSLFDPNIITVTSSKDVRLRIINGAASTNYQIDLGELEGTLIAVDGENIKPVKGNKFPIGIANRLDILVNLPEQGGTFPILGLAEGTKKQTGLILTTDKTKTLKLNPISKKTMGRVNYYKLEKQLHSLVPLVKNPIDITLNFSLQGTMSGYVWSINKESWPNITPSVVKKGDRVEMVFSNQDSMSHPMHFHGHVFQVTEIDGMMIENGAKRDTILVQPNTTIKVQFDANNPGVWVMHCHNLYHMAAGMLTTIEFKDYPLPDFYLKAINLSKTGVS